MILADTSVWIDHFRQSDPKLFDLLERDLVLMHPFVLGELAMGNLKDRELALARLSLLRATPVASPNEVLALVENRRLCGCGIGYIDAHLLAATLVADIADLKLWTRDRRLQAAAEGLGVASEFSTLRLQ
jgi:predicted nucleic acid-binding protein